MDCLDGESASDIGDDFMDIHERKAMDMTL